MAYLGSNFTDLRYQCHSKCQYIAGVFVLQALFYFFETGSGVSRPCSFAAPLRALTIAHYTQFFGNSKYLFAYTIESSEIRTNAVQKDGGPMLFGPRCAPA